MQPWGNTQNFQITCWCNCYWHVKNGPLTLERELFFPEKTVIYLLQFTIYSYASCLSKCCGCSSKSFWPGSCVLLQLQLKLVCHKKKRKKWTWLTIMVMLRFKSLLSSLLMFRTQVFTMEANDVFIFFFFDKRKLWFLLHVCVFLRFFFLETCYYSSIKEKKINQKLHITAHHTSVIVGKALYRWV